jgi:hypothetical protein
MTRLMGSLAGLCGSRLRRWPDRLRASADQRAPDLAGHLPAPDPHGGQPCPRLPADLDPVVPRPRNKLDGGVFGPITVVLAEQEPGQRERMRNLELVSAHGQAQTTSEPVSPGKPQVDPCLHQDLDRSLAHH